MIIAVDFDGILCDNEFPEIGAPHYEMITAVRRLMDEGHEVILWTSRADQRLVEAVRWCDDYGLHFCAINDNAPSNKEKYAKAHPQGTRKVYADMYIEDHCPWFMNWDSDRHHVNAVEMTITYMKRMAKQWKEEN